MNLDYKKLTDQMKAAARKLYDHRCQMGNGGNLSIRIPGKDLMLVKATDVGFDEVDWNTVVLTDFDGNGGQEEGTTEPLPPPSRPSKEALLHGAIYRELEWAGAVMHCHSPYAVSWAAGHDSLEFSTYHSALKLGGFVPVFDTRSYAVPKDTIPLIVEFFKENPGSKALLLRGHGQVTVGKDMREAVYLSELLEETAQISILSSIHG